MSTYLLAAVQNRHLHLCLWHIMFLGGMLVCLIEVVPLIWLFLVDQKNCPIFYFPLFVSSSQAWRHTFSPAYDDLDQTNHTFFEILSFWLSVAKISSSTMILKWRSSYNHIFSFSPSFPSFLFQAFFSMDSRHPSHPCHLCRPRRFRRPCHRVTHVIFVKAVTTVAPSSFSETA